MWSRHSRRIVPISLSTYAFCQGELGAINSSAQPNPGGSLPPPKESNQKGRRAPKMKLLNTFCVCPASAPWLGLGWFCPVWEKTKMRGVSVVAVGEGDTIRGVALQRTADSG